MPGRGTGWELIVRDSCGWLPSVVCKILLFAFTPQCLDKALNSSQPCGNRASVANFHGAYSLSWSFREAVDRNFPELSIDWTAVADDLAQGPSEDPPLSTTEWDWARMEHHR